ncbi:MAG: hypothetical protein JOY80_03855 [Candidatus Dormibacteraeota bacterium]|nr:hypothetical protein [Candidatus Dormibacteraeota bacterium]
MSVGGRRFRVQVSEQDRDGLAPRVSVETLVSESFRFLLEREPVTSILESFDLSVIERYFPEYRHEMADRLGV